MPKPAPKPIAMTDTMTKPTSPPPSVSPEPPIPPRPAPLERCQKIEQLLANSRLLHLGDAAASTVGDSRLGDLVIFDRVVWVEMSRGRMMPATLSSRTSKFTRTSWLPLTMRLPFGSTPVTTAAIQKLDFLRSVDFALAVGLGFSPSVSKDADHQYGSSPPVVVEVIAE